MKIKICGLTSDADVHAVNAVIPDYVGMVFAPSRRQITEEQAWRLRQRLYPEIKVVGVFVNQPIAMITRLLLAEVIDCVQLHGDESCEYLDTLTSLISAPIIKAVVMTSDRPTNAARVRRYERSEVNYLLLDSGRGSGITFDWTTIPATAKPFFLAGGLTPENLPSAITAAAPHAFDLSSGVETDGKKDAAKIANVVAQIRALP